MSEIFFEKFGKTENVIWKIIFKLLSRMTPRGLSAQAGAWETLRKKGRITVLKCCNIEIKNGELWILKDIKGFCERKLYTAKCPICKDDVALLIEKRIEDGKVFLNNLTKLNALKTIYREKKRALKVFPDIKSDKFFSWVYGTNVQIKNKKGEIVQIRQYATDFKGKKTLIKKLTT